MKRTSLIVRLVAVLLLLSLLPFALFSCAASETVSAKKVIGEVDGEKIYYDELYFLIKTYEESLKKEYANDPEGLAEALDELAATDLISNVAMIRLCEKHGLKYTNRNVKDAVKAELESMIATSFDGDEEAFLASMEEAGLTERYLRYTLGVDSLYDQLLTVYPEEGLVATSQKEVKAYIMENFIHVYHIALYNDTEDEDAENLKNMTEARKMLLSGEFTMYHMLRGSKKVVITNDAGERETVTINLSAYNEDLSDLSGNGFYLTRGTWETAYEDAAFALKMGEISQVVKVENTARSVPAYYVIQRAEMDEEYVDEHLSELQEEYYASVIYSDLLEVRESLRFEPNDFYKSLDLTDLNAPREGVGTLTIVLCILGGAVLVGGAVTTVVLIKKKKTTTK